MKLSVLERLLLLNILPQQGTITTIKIVHELREGLSFSEEEHAALQFVRPAEGGTRWEEGAVEDKEVQIGPRAHALIVEALEKMDKEEKLTEEYVGVWDKFMTDRQVVSMAERAKTVQE